MRENRELLMFVQWPLHNDNDGKNTEPRVGTR